MKRGTKLRTKVEKKELIFCLALGHTALEAYSNSVTSLCGSGYNPEL